jgi:hypothetical protein
MKKGSEIWNELNSVSPFLAGMGGSEDLWEVPAGYFEQFPAYMQEAVRSALSPDPSPSWGLQARENPFRVPKGYWDRFPAQMMSLIRAQQANSPEEELEVISPLLSGLDKKTPFEVPSGYFTELSENLVMGLKALDQVQDELEKDSSLIHALDKSELYELPAGYFETFPDRALSRVKQIASRKPAKIISLLGARSWMKYAAAAMVAGVLLTGGLLWFNSSPNSTAKPIQLTIPLADKTNFATVSDQEILNYLESQNVPETDLNSLASIDLGDNESVGDNEGNNLLSGVSDEELQQYVNENSAPKNQADN